MTTPLDLDNLSAPLRTDAHGVVRVGKTRVTIDTVIYAFQQGEEREEIRESYPAVTLAEIYGTIAYYLRNQEAVDAYLHEREAEAERIRAEIEARWPPDGMRERLRARKAAREARMRNVVLRPIEDGWWLAEVPSLPGCATQGATKEEALENVKEAIGSYIESLLIDGEPIPEDVEVRFVGM